MFISKSSHIMQVTNTELLRPQHSQSLCWYSTAVLSSYGFGFSSHSKVHLKLPASLTLPFTSHCLSEILSDACSEQWSKICWIDPCCDLSSVQRAYSQLYWRLLFSGDCDARSAWQHTLQLVPQTRHSLGSGDMEQVSHILNLQLRLHQKNHSVCCNRTF